MSVGYCTNLYDLLMSTSDAASPLDGRTLVMRKVRELVLMGGRRAYPEGADDEWNFSGATGVASICSPGECHGRAHLGFYTNQTLALWPRGTPLTFLDYETGVDVLTGQVLAEQAAEQAGSGDSPCRYAYEACNGM